MTWAQIEAELSGLLGNGGSKAAGATSTAVGGTTPAGGGSASTDPGTGTGATHPVAAVVRDVRSLLTGDGQGVDASTLGHALREAALAGFAAVNGDATAAHQEFHALLAGASSTAHGMHAGS